MGGLDVALIRPRRKRSKRPRMPRRDDAGWGKDLYMTENTKSERGGPAAARPGVLTRK